MSSPEPIGANEQVMAWAERVRNDPRRPGVAVPERPQTAATDGGEPQGVQPYAGGVTAGTAALRGHVAVTPDGRLDLSPTFAVSSVVALVALGVVLGTAGG